MYKRNRVFLGQNRISRSQGTLFTLSKLQHSPGRCRGNCCSYAHICENYKYLLENFTFSSSISNCQSQLLPMWYQFLTWNERGNSWILKICLARKMNHVDYTQSPIIRNNPIRFGAEFLGKFKKRVLGRSRSIFQTFWNPDFGARFLFIELDASNFGYLLIF